MPGECESGVRRALEDGEKALMNIVQAERIKSSYDEIEAEKKEAISDVTKRFMCIEGLARRFADSTRPKRADKETQMEFHLHKKGVSYHLLARVFFKCRSDVAVYRKILASAKDLIKRTTNSPEDTEDALFEWFMTYRVPTLEGSELQRLHDMLGQQTSEALEKWEAAQSTLVSLRDSNRLCAQRCHMWDIEHSQGRRVWYCISNVRCETSGK